MNKENVKIIKRYVSNLDHELVLATVSTRSDQYFSEVLGEQLKEFANEAAAIRHAEETLKFFYVTRDAGL